jgi:hypothetical protein
VAIRLNAPLFVIHTADLGSLTFTSLRVKDMRRLEAIPDGKAGATLAPEAFVDQFIMALGRKTPKPVERTGTAGVDLADIDPPEADLSEEDLRSLRPEERTEIVERLLSSLEDSFFYEDVREIETNEAGERISKIVGRKLILPREEGESDEAYLQRGWTAYRTRITESMQNAFKGITGPAASFSASLKGLLGPGLMSNISASQHLADQIAKMASPTQRLAEELERIKPFPERMRDLGITDVRPSEVYADILKPGEPTPLSRIVIPPNPIHETNELLSQMAERIEEMHELARSTATTQQTLNELARDAVSLFATGAEESKSAADTGLKISRRAFTVAVISAALGALALGLTTLGLFQQNGTSAETARVESQRHAEMMRLRQDELAATNRLAEALEKAQRAPPPAKGGQ